jgi:hypothetical protein
MRSLLIVCPLLLQACGHHRQAATPSAPLAAPATDRSHLTDNDVRLFTEALAYDLTHGAWLNAYGDAAEAAPQLSIGDVPQKVPPSGVPFPRAAFIDNLTQSLRNGRRVEVLAPTDRPGTPVWRLNLAVHHDQDTVEGQPSYGYHLKATLHLCPSDTVAWQQEYAVRKRRGEAVDDAAVPPAS